LESDATIAYHIYKEVEVAKEKIPNPYIPSGGMLVQTFAQLRKMFPPRVDAETLRKLSLAPKNESMVINVLRFLGFIDDEGKKSSSAATVFSKHQDEAFAAELEKVVSAAYVELFNTMGTAAWESDRSTLIGFFRVHDETSELTATRQAIAFETLASLSGHGELVKSKATGPRTTPKTEAKKKPIKPNLDKGVRTPETPDQPLPKAVQGALGMTVRIEINLPAQGDQETYDRIFQSIRRNLIDG